MTDAHSDCDVLIVGAGPVGLALATELASRGISVRVIEQNERVGVQPRAKTTNVRTMEHMRRWGLVGKMRGRSTMLPDQPRRVLFSTTLFGREVYSFENALCAAPIRDERYPEHAEFIPQYVVEGILLDHVTAHPLVTVSFRRRLEEFEQTGSNVTATVSDGEGSQVETIRARFLVGADGARSSVRKRLGIKMSGQSGLVSFVTLVLHLPGLRADPDLRPALFYWLLNPEAPSIMAPMGRDDTWFWSMALPEGASSEETGLVERVRACIGRDVAIEILARDDWTAHRLIADRYRDGVVFLAGDACHLHSPFGGHGMNLGIGDAVDLGWKLAAVLQGWADSALLDTYEIERRPVHEWVLETSTENLASLSDQFASPHLNNDGPEGDAARRAAAAAIEEAKTPEFHSLGLVIGYRYSGSPTIAKEGGPAPETSVTHYAPSAWPGARAPHCWLADGTSLFDHFGPGFTLLRTEGAGHASEGDLLRAAMGVRLPLTVVAPDDDRLRELYGARYALIRPDQHVSWRGDVIEDPDELIGLVRGANGQRQSRDDPVRRTA